MLTGNAAASVTVGVNKLSVVHKSSNGVTIAFPDTCKTPSPTGPIPIPYPNIAMTSDTKTTTSKVKTTGTPVKSSRYKLKSSQGGELSIVQSLDINSVTKAIYTDSRGSKTEIRGPALIKLDNGELCAICALRDGTVTKVFRLIPNNTKTR